MIRREYSAGAVKFSFWFMEFKTVINLLSEGMTFDEIKMKTYLVLQHHCVPVRYSIQYLQE